MSGEAFTGVVVRVCRGGEKYEHAPNVYACVVCLCLCMRVRACACVHVCMC